MSRYQEGAEFILPFRRPPVPVPQTVYVGDMMLKQLLLALKRLLRALGPVLVGCIFLGAVYLLYREISSLFFTRFECIYIFYSLFGYFLLT